MSELKMTTDGRKGHYGCNQNGEHERCGELSCGMYASCKVKNTMWFGEEKVNMSENGCTGCKYVNCAMDSKECSGCKRNATDKYKRMTNADRIRSMSDVDLLKFIYDVNTNCIPVTICEGECVNCNLGYDFCKNGYKQWLQKEVEE